MKAIQAAGLVLFNRKDEVVEEWPGGWLPVMVQRELEDKRNYVLAVGCDRAMLFIDHPEKDSFYAWQLKRDSDTMEDAADFLVLTAKINSLADFLAMGFEYL